MRRKGGITRGNEEKYIKKWKNKRKPGRIRNESQTKIRGRGNGQDIDLYIISDVYLFSN